MYDVKCTSKDSNESDEEFRQIVSNVHSRTMEGYEGFFKTKKNEIECECNHMCTC